MSDKASKAQERATLRMSDKASKEQERATLRISHKASKAHDLGDGAREHGTPERMHGTPGSHGVAVADSACHVGDGDDAELHGLTEQLQKFPLEEGKKN